MKDPFVRRVRRALEELVGAGERIPVVLAVSGGADSTALLKAASTLAGDEWSFVVAHVDHELRGAASRGDAEFVRSRADELGLPFACRRAPVDDGGNLEERAREARYDALHAIALDAGAAVIATGHTIEDRAESFLLAALRGSGPSGLSGLRSRRGDGVVRPLLNESRGEVRAFLLRHRLAWREDATNAEARFLRNRVRAEVLPLLESIRPGATGTLARGAALLETEDEALESGAAWIYDRLAESGGLDRRAFRSLPPSIRPRVVRRWLRSARGDLRGIRRDQLAAVERLLASTEGGWRVDVAGGRVRFRDGRLEWEPRKPPGAC